MSSSVRFICLLAFSAFALGAIQGFWGGHFAYAMAEDPLAVEYGSAVQLADAVWIDARSESQYATQHLEGAILLNEDNWDAGLDELLQIWIPGQPVVVYCDGGGCAASRHVAERLREEFGMEQVFWLIDGWDALIAAGRVTL
jgi:rhodanese-related sulfurtransferase